MTFYRFPLLSFLENWCQSSPVDFRFAVKAPRLITQYKQFNNDIGGSAIGDATWLQAYVSAGR
ncbi:DUF72 domain-containing protein [Hymenobacter radiodurans]|uniref:DUF72 domain-containing protein n=1 Tax=Hymenobacter radiodurans TaxID=2496028 RepID=UPI00196A8E19|nr:DUF72 domain-containing protein [Hymenobacter radiodurans]